MKSIYLFLAVVFLISLPLQAQQGQVNSPQIGDKLLLGTPSGSSYSHIDVPRKNFIIKRGGIANTSSLINTAIIVTDITYGEKTIITFKRADKRKFFRVYKTLSADLESGIDSGELIIPKT